MRKFNFPVTLSLSKCDMEDHLKCNLYCHTEALEVRLVKCFFQTLLREPQHDINIDLKLNLLLSLHWMRKFNFPDTLSLSKSDMEDHLKCNLYCHTEALEVRLVKCFFQTLLREPQHDIIIDLKFKSAFVIILDAGSSTLSVGSSTATSVYENHGQKEKIATAHAGSPKP